MSVGARVALVSADGKYDEHQILPTKPSDYFAHNRWCTFTGLSIPYLGLPEGNRSPAFIRA
jgi:hypothetical protein